MHVRSFPFVNKNTDSRLDRLKKGCINRHLGWQTAIFKMKSDHFRNMTANKSLNKVEI